MEICEKCDLTSDRVNQAKNYLKIEEEIAKYIHLEKVGEHLKAQCPFCGLLERSFTVSPNKQIFYCFNCHKGGDVIAFLQTKLTMKPQQIVHRIEKYKALQELKK